jgi:hypothetical protein
MKCSFDYHLWMTFRSSGKRIMMRFAPHSYQQVGNKDFPFIGTVGAFRLGGTSFPHKGTWISPQGLFFPRPVAKA